MGQDIEQLTVTLRANMADYAADLDKARAETARQTANMEASFAKLGTFGQRPSQNLDKLASGMSSVGKAALTSQVENELLNASLNRTGVAADGVSHAIGGLTTHGAAAFHALRGGAEQLLAGQDPFRVLALELNNLTYAASGAGGLKGAFQEAIGIFGRLLNPVTAAIGVVVGLGAAALGLGQSFAKSRGEIDLALTGVGRAAGVTVSGVQDIADKVSEAGELSRSEATKVATAIAATGRASAESTERATALAHAYSLVFNKDINKSAADLAQAIADPAGAIDALNQRLGAWSANQVELVKNLTASGQRQAAAKIVIDGLTKSLDTAATKTDLLSQKLNSIGNTLSDAASRFGKSVYQALGGELSPEDQLTQAKEQLQGLQSGHFNLFGGVSYGSADDISQAKAKVDELTASIEAARKAADDPREAGDVSNIITDIDPTLKKLSELQNSIDRIKAQAAKGGLSDQAKGVVDSVVASQQAQHDALLQNFNLSKQQLGVGNAQYEIDKRSSDLQIAALAARTPIQKAQIAYQQTLNELQDKAPDVAQAEAQIAYNKSLAESVHTLSEAQRDRIFQGGQSVASAEIENSTIGQSVDVVTTLTQRFQLLAAAQAEAHKNGTVVSPEELAAMDEAARKLGQLAQAAAALKAQNDAKFDIEQLGRSSSDQNVYSALNSAGLVQNGQIVSAQAQQTAAILKTKEALSDLADTEKAFASSFLSDLIQGKSAAVALGDALTAVANKLLDKGIDQLIAGIGSSGANKGLLSLFGFADGGVFVPGSGPQPLKRYAGGGVSNTAAIFGEAGPEAAIPLKGGKVPVDLRMSSLPNVSAPSRATSQNVSISIDARNSTPAAVDKLNAETLPQLRKLIKSEVLDMADRSAGLKKKLGR